jgi:hypothetical protein
MADDVADYPTTASCAATSQPLRTNLICAAISALVCAWSVWNLLGPTTSTPWRVSVRNAEGELETAIYKGVVIANGILAEPNRPAFEASLRASFCTPARHKSAEQFKEQRVLIIGAGNSGCDIAVDAVHMRKAWISRCAVATTLCPSMCLANRRTPSAASAPCRAGSSRSSTAWCSSGSRATRAL